MVRKTPVRPDPAEQGAFEPTGKFRKGLALRFGTRRSTRPLFSIQRLGRASRPCHAPPLAAEKKLVLPNGLTAEVVTANGVQEKKLYVVTSLGLVATRPGKLWGPVIQPTFPNEF